jgi:hypothetical protein
MVNPIKMILLAQFFQLLAQAQDLPVLGHSKTNLSFKSLGFVGEQLAYFSFCGDTNFVIFFSYNECFDFQYA